MPSIFQIFRALRNGVPSVDSSKAPGLNAIIPVEKKPVISVNQDHKLHGEAAVIARAIRDKRAAILVHGRAGTGKTTLIRTITSEGKFRHAIVAPTGIAALNARGQTIHSFFGVPFGVCNLDDIRATWKLGEILRRLDVLIIDEISMVRADLLDVIDRKLQANLRSDLSFGGLPVLMVGDFLQLPPVVTDNERDMLDRKGYEVHYAFGAKVFDRVNPLIIELKKVYRQREADFIDLLGQVRTGQNIGTVVAELNARCHGAHKTANPPIILAARNVAADEYNKAGLNRLSSNPKFYTAHVEGEFRADRYPAPEELELKCGARIMMVKNDSEKRWVNGSLGTVVRLSDDCAWVKIDGTSVECDVQRATWENTKYEWSEKHQKVEQKVLGRYSQLPIRHAWAITIHKSQGLTLQDVRIDLGVGAFTYGQTYVALSRATSLEGLSFSSPLRIEDIRVDYDVVSGIQKFG